MRGILIGMALAFFAAPALAQTSDETRCVSADPAVRIGGCTAVIGSAQESRAGMAVAYFNRGRAFSELRRFDQALADLNQAVRLNPADARDYDERGNAYAGKGLYDQAIADYSQAIALRPDVAGYYRNRALAYRGEGAHGR
jgi:tetratricopeptide (TPR) repeat protein